METLKKLFAKAPTSIGVVTHGISSCQVGEVSPLGASRCGASTEAASTCLAPNLLIIIKRTRTTFNGVKSNSKRYPYSVLRDSDLTHIPKVQWPVFIMKKKILHTL